MPFALLIAGIFLLVAGVRGTQTQLFSLIHGDFTGTNNFIYWLLAILAIGAVGYIPRLKNVSHVMLALVIVVLFLSRGGFFAQFTSAIATTGSFSQSGTAASIGSPTLTQQQVLQNAQQTLQQIQQQLQATF